MANIETRLREWAVTIWERKLDKEDKDNLYDELIRAADEIESLMEDLEAERKKHEWVSVEDRLPEEWKEVIACDENAVVYPQARWFFGRRHDERIWEWAYEAGMDYWVSVDVPVTHWMPLPDPPKGEEDE